MRNHLGPGVIGAAGLGAGLMFFLDPDISNRRRAILRDKLVSLGHLAGWAADKTARGVRNCLNGALQSYKVPVLRHAGHRRCADGTCPFENGPRRFAPARHSCQRSKWPRPIDRGNSVRSTGRSHPVRVGG